MKLIVIELQHQAKVDELTETIKDLQRKVLQVTWSHDSIALTDFNGGAIDLVVDKSGGCQQVRAGTALSSS